jgi:RTX calcium-binding nonapeptide repeat (4 copies)
MTRLSIANAEPIGARVVTSMFGANLLFNRDRPLDGSYGDVFDLAGATEVRYPGGSITEWMFDVTRPDKTSAWGDDGNLYQLLPLTEFMAWAAANNHVVTIVIPTRDVLGSGLRGTREVSEEAIKEIGVFVRQLLNERYGSAEVSTLEIGNEYYYSGEMSAIEYGKVASAVALEIDRQIAAFRAINNLPDSWEGPRVAVQMGQAGTSGTPGWIQNDQIMAEFNAREAAAVDAVTGHFYALENVDYDTNVHWMFRLMETWQSDSRFGYLDYVVTEWNADMHSTTLTGLLNVSSITIMLGEMVKYGVDAAHIWPLQQTTINDLAGNEGNGTLTAVGEMFRMLSTNVRGGYLDYRQIETDYVFHSFSRPDETVVLVSSRTGERQTFTQDVDQLVEDYGRIRATLLSVDGDPLDPSADAVIRTFWLEADWRGTVSFALGPYETIMLEIMEEPVSRYTRQASGSAAADLLKGGAGNDRLNGRAGADDLFGRSGDDTLDGGEGKDRLIGGIGNDIFYVNRVDDVVIERRFGGTDTIRTSVSLQLPANVDNLQATGERSIALTGNGLDNNILGNAGANRLYGWSGDDTVSGAGGNDNLFGNRGDDTLNGGRGNDCLSDPLGDNLLRGGIGNDFLLGGGGRDELRGGDGDDSIFGGGGADLIGGGRGNDVISGGVGNDTFVFHIQSGRDAIRDFEVGSDQFRFLGQLAVEFANRDYVLLQRNGATMLELGDVSIWLGDVSVRDVSELF